MKELSIMLFLVLISNGVLLVVFGILTAISLVIFKWLTNRKINNNSIKCESLFIILNSILLVFSMCGFALSGWYTILHYCY